MGIVGLIAVFSVEDIARVTGEFNKTILLVGIITVLIIILSSLFSIVKANSNRIKREIIISAFFTLIPLAASVMNGLIYIVYFVGN